MIVPRFLRAIPFALLAALLAATSALAAAPRAAPKGVVGVIDNGSMGSKLKVIDAHGNILAEREVSTRIGRGLDADGLLKLENRDRAIKGLRSLIRTARRFGLKPGDLEVVSTAAVRNAKGFVPAASFAAGKRTGRQFNRDDLQERLGLKRARVLSGAAEGRLGYLGAVLPLRATAKRGEKFLVLDFGGGSHQRTRGTARQVISSESIQVGFNSLVDAHMVDATGQALESLPTGILDRLDATLHEKVPHSATQAIEVAGARPVLSGGIGRYLAMKFGKEEITRGDLEKLRIQLAVARPNRRGKVLLTDYRGKQLSAHDRGTVGLGGKTTFRDERVSFVATLSLVLHELEGDGLTRPTDKILLTQSDVREEIARARLGGP